MLGVINTIAWIGSNLILAYIAVVVFLFVILYYVFFDPKATTAGKMIFKFMLSLVGILVMVCIGVFIDPQGAGPFQPPGVNVESWRPILRLVIYGFVAWTVTTLTIALIMRKWFRHKVKKKSDLALVKPRHDTGILPIVERP